ncbi:hypothetical protein GGX14DRAFT_396094 [Mycena pura]|uniref:DUF6532 domain-containing protein n=1 Tax=Mycena pura TaxID=153505 RepID=A0AAD6VEZ0_9AGAR|nr:hypothetical protein GGX14DRAFT_396094 [Mycena pura]
MVHSLSNDETDPVDVPPRKKSRKEPNARSIVGVAPDRQPVLELAYTYIQLKVLTDPSKTWLHGRPELALATQEAFDWALNQMQVQPDLFEPVTHLEQDLCRERIYGARGELKELARLIAASDSKNGDGFGFMVCSVKATKEEQERIAGLNRALVETLTHKSAFCFEDPLDRTMKGSMYQHTSIGAAVNKGVYDGLVSYGMQYPDYFDDSLFRVDPTQEDVSHKPTLSLVLLALIVTALRAAIMEWSSGHFIPETFSRKIYKPHFDRELKVLREWRDYTSNATIIPGGGPVRKAPASFLTRTLQETLLAEARANVLKDVVAPVPSVVPMDASDFALNQ